MLDIHTERHHYTEIIPAIVNTRSLVGTGQLPKFSEDLYRIEDSDYWLSSTAEVQLTNIYRKTIMSESELPIDLQPQLLASEKRQGVTGRTLRV